MRPVLSLLVVFLSDRHTPILSLFLWCSGNAHMANDAWLPYLFRTFSFVFWAWRCHIPEEGLWLVTIGCCLWPLLFSITKPRSDHHNAHPSGFSIHLVYFVTLVRPLKAAKLWNSFLNVISKRPRMEIQPKPMLYYSMRFKAFHFNFFYFNF